MDAARVGDFLASLRKSKGYTQQEVADELNVSNKTVSKWEQGGGFPEITVLPALAGVLRRFGRRNTGRRTNCKRSFPTGPGVYRGKKTAAYGYGEAEV